MTVNEADTETRTVSAGTIKMLSTLSFSGQELLISSIDPMLYGSDGLTQDTQKQELNSVPRPVICSHQTLHFCVL
jgi:hypothetical protein